MQDAYLSNDLKYRYWLIRQWNNSLPSVVWVMLNPSTADERIDDATIRKCLSYTREWGAGGIVVVNLYALRSRDPKLLLTAPDPIGPHNNRWLAIWLEHARRTGAQVICAWGRRAEPRRVQWLKQLATETGTTLYCLEMGKHQPNHPLYLHGGITPQRMN